MRTYVERLAARLREVERLSRLDVRAATLRLTCVAALVAVGFGVIRLGWSPSWLFVPAASFVGAAVWHDRVLRAKHAAETAATFYRHGIARIDDQWIGNGRTGDRFLDEHHPSANDLDLFGRGSLFELLSLARTHVGEDTLAMWLKAPAPSAVVLQRQAAITELRDHLDFREALATAGKSAADLDTTTLRAWMTQPIPTVGWVAQATGAILTVAIAATLWWWIADGPLGALAFALLLKAIHTRVLHRRVSMTLDGVEGPIHQLDTLSDVLIEIERAAFTSPRLATLRAELVTKGVPPSAAIKRLQRLANMLDWQRNPFFAPFAAALSWSTHLAAAIGQWRRTFGSQVPAWLAVLGEYEALSSLSAYNYEHPNDPFPVLLDDSAPATFRGDDLGHPLVPSAQMVRNSVTLSPPQQLLVVSGSNMSGKSTLLRTVGINAVLAMAGAPVRAAALTMTPLTVGATLHVQDSLQAGRSRFFTEITRVREISDLSGGRPALLFLLDELFQGTNSHDRKAGAVAVLRHLVDRGAIGLITTHDLALTAIADELGGRAVNVHFQDDFRGTDMVFDYKMRPGPVTHSNALALMQAVGLSVADGRVVTDKTRYE